MQAVEAAEATDLAAALECVLYLAGEPLSTSEIARILEVTESRAEQIVEALSGSIAGRGLQVIRVAGGYRLTTKAKYAQYVERLHPPARVRLSRPALETLAIVAYRGPITRPEIEAIRGVNVDGVIETLLNHRLVCEKGRKDTVGRPMLYATTEDFLTHFGLNSLSDLPPLPEGASIPLHIPQPSDSSAPLDSIQASDSGEQPDSGQPAEQEDAELPTTS